MTEQSVYESFADLPDETRAITVQRSADSPVFLFEPPKRIPSGSWTQWQLPNMQSSSFDYVYQYYYRRDAPHSEPESGAPRVDSRYFPSRTILHVFDVVLRAIWWRPRLNAREA